MNDDNRIHVSRCISGCGGFLKKIDMALSVQLDTILDPDNEDSTDNRMLTSSCMRKRGAKATPGSETTTYTAAICADAAIARGLTSPTALHIITLLHRSATQYNMDVRNSPRFRVLKNLWRALDKREEEMVADEKKGSEGRTGAFEATDGAATPSDGAAILGDHLSR
ncbi:hypothetical protein C8R45DRAFT_939908 [Mycena sanguinolenta]|nr:hypothetical protein C8R45DRAFT_939908 [Mycena sanguinolenta]